MKKLLMAAAALGLAASPVATSAAQAENHSRYEQRHDNGNHYGKRWREHNYYNWNYDRRYRGNSYYYWRYFQRLPSYYYGRCDTRWQVVVRDPYTGRLVCMNRIDYDRYRLEIRINL